MSASDKNHARLSKRRHFRDRLNAPEPVHAPLALNALMARQAEQAGFEALYLGGGALGYEKVFLEANLSITELAQTGLDIASACPLPVILDGAAGFGDPMHMHRTIPLAEAAGFVAIEIEDQLLPKRAHHHIGIEHMIPRELMAAKVKESVRARRDEDFLIIARTNALRVSNRDDAIARLQAYKEAGADALLLAQYHAAAGVYAQLKADRHAPAPEGSGGWHAIGDAVHETIDLDGLLQVEKETVEKS